MFSTNRIEEDRLWFFLRCFLALLVSVHGWHRLYLGSVLPFAEHMQTQIFGGYFLVLILQAMELVGSLLLAFGWFTSILSYIFAIIYLCSIYFYHSHFGWFQSGGEQNGAEYAVALIMCFLAVGLRYQPRPFWAWSDYLRPRLLSPFKAHGISRSLQDLPVSWQILRSTLLALIAIHVIYRFVAWDFDTMASLIAPFLPYSTGLAICVTVVQGFGLMAILFGRYRMSAYVLLIVLYVLAIVFHHFGQGWIVSGSENDGMEYVLLLIVMMSCCALFERNKNIDEVHFKRRAAFPHRMD